MEAFVLAVAAISFAGVSSASLCWWALGEWGVVRSNATRGMVEKDGRVAWLMRHGIAPLLPLSEWLLAFSVVNSLARDGVLVVNRKGFSSSVTTLCSVVLAAAFALFVLSWVVSGAMLTGILVTVCAIGGTAIWVRSVEEKECQLLREETPEIVRSMSACLSAGLSLEQTFGQLEKETSGSLRSMFARMEGVLKTGGTADQALSELKGFKPVPELAFIAVALDVQHQTGGSLRRVLDSARGMVEDELELQRSLRVQTAQAKLSARIVTVMPFFLIALFSLTTEGFLEPFFQSVAGLALLGLAVLMQVMGVMLVRHMLTVQE